MSTEFNSIKRGLLEVIDHADGHAMKSDEDAKPTTEVTLWLDAEVIAKFKALGDDWQARINEVLRQHA